jgi:class 3 adenylate cyclase
VRELGLEVRAGLHTGECEIRGDKVAGIAVNIGARVMSNAGPNEVLVSSTVKDLVAGSGITFDDRGPATLKGIGGQWRLYAVKDEADVYATAPALV